MRTSRNEAHRRAFILLTPRVIGGPRRDGFTLVELLVVLAVITVLMALLMPALVRARKQAQAVVCAANLRSIGQAMTLYTQRYGYYPSCYINHNSRRYAIWPVRLRMFTGGDQGVFYCSAQDERCEWRKVAPEPGAAGRATDVHARFGYELGEPLLDVDVTPFSYGYSYRGAADFAGQPPDENHKGLGGYVDVAPPPPPFPIARELRASRVRRPAEMIAITDSTADRVSDLLVVPNHYSLSVLPGTIHNRGANVLFCDGHVQWYPQKALLVTYSGSPDIPSEYPIRRMWNNDHRPNVNLVD